MIEKIKELKQKHNITIAAHYYQVDEVFECADLVGDSLELAKKSKNINLIKISILENMNLWDILLIK